MVREWAHNPTLNGSIPNSSLIKKLTLTKSIFVKNKNKITVKKLVSIRLNLGFNVMNYNVLLSNHSCSILNYNVVNLNITNLPIYMYLSIIHRTTKNI
jgi:hypothetical protein